MKAREKAKRCLEDSWKQIGLLKALEVSGRSMGDALPDGSLAYIRYGACKTLRHGALVLFRHGEQRIVHRLLFRFGPLFVEKGDANRYPKIRWTKELLGTVEHMDWTLSKGE